jgi:hypothetical protein
VPGATIDAGKNYKKNQCSNAQPCAQAMRNSINQLFTPVWFAVYQISDLLLFEFVNTFAFSA